MPARSAAESAAGWLQDFVVQVLRSPSWETPVLDFIDAHCGSFDGADENRLEYTQLHEQFCALVERLLEAHLADIGLTAEDFAAVCAAAPRGSGLHSAVFEQILSCTDFLTFKSLMRKRSAELELEAVRALHVEAAATAAVAGRGGVKRQPKPRQRHRRGGESDAKQQDADSAYANADSGGDDDLRSALELSVLEPPQALDQQEQNPGSAAAAAAVMLAANVELAALERDEEEALRAYEEAQLAAAIAASLASDEAWRREAEDEAVSVEKVERSSLAEFEDVVVGRDKQRRREAEVLAREAVAKQRAAAAAEAEAAAAAAVAEAAVSMAGGGARAAEPRHQAAISCGLCGAANSDDGIAWSADIRRPLCRACSSPAPPPVGSAQPSAGSRSSFAAASLQGVPPLQVVVPARAQRGVLSKSEGGRESLAGEGAASEPRARAKGADAPRSGGLSSLAGMPSIFASTKPVPSADEQAELDAALLSGGDGGSSGGAYAGGGGGGGGGGAHGGRARPEPQVGVVDAREVRERQEHLRAMREALLEKRRRERKIALEAADASAGAGADAGVRATLQAALAQVKGDKSAEDKEKASRLALAARLRTEGGVGSGK